MARQLPKSEIPKGRYCYTPIQSPCEENGWVFKVKCCPYWEHYNKEIHGELPLEYRPYEKEFQGAYCKYLELGDWMENGTMLLWDQVKECGENDDWEDDPWDEVE